MPQEINHEKEDIRRNLCGNPALIALGANLPLPDKTPQETLESAILSLSEAGLVIRARSQFYETPCFPAGAGPDYVNAAISADWAGEAQALLALLHEVEAAFSRRREVRWGMRTLDLDLIALGDAVLPETATWKRWHGLRLEDQMRLAPDRLILPHPRMQERGFVLVPLADVAPDWRHPVLGRTVADMLDTLPPDATADVKPL